MAIAIPCGSEREKGGTPMAYWDVVFRRQTWSDYVTSQDQSRAFEDALKAQTKGLTRSNAQIALSQRDYEIALRSGLGALEETISRDMGSLTNTMVLGFNSLANGIDKLNADFNLMMGDVIWKLEMLQDTLNDILQEIRLAEFEREARAFRIRGEDSYRNGWYDRALIDFLEAENRNYKDFAVLRSIGNIYLYHLIDLPKSLDYFRKTAKYSRPNDSRQSAEAEYFAGIVCSVQQNIKDAAAHMLEATELNPNLYQAFYMHSEFAAMLNDPVVAVRSLEKAIRGDARYHERAKIAEAFGNARPQVLSLLDGLMREITEEARGASRAIKALHVRCDTLLLEDKSKVSQLLDNAETQLSDAKTYNDYCQFLFAPEHIEPELRIAEQRRDKRIQSDQEEVDGLEHKISGQKDAIASGWKRVGLAVAILAGLFLAAIVCANFCNGPVASPNSISSALAGMLTAVLKAIGCLGAIVFWLAFWPGILVVLVMVVWQIANTSAALARIAKLRTEIVHCEATRWKRPLTITS
jgi:tetratricopeptide (TPR) repeat protein